MNNTVIELKGNEIKAGTMYVPGTVDVTDPCYERSVWCRINDVEVLPGEYDCSVWRNPDDYGRVSGIMISYNGEREPAELKPGQFLCSDLIGEIGVDAGLAGFFVNKPDFTTQEWNAFCEHLDETGMYSGDRYCLEDGRFFSQSGWGDGCYEVWGWRESNGYLVGLIIIFD